MPIVNNEVISKSRYVPAPEGEYEARIDDVTTGFSPKGGKELLIKWVGLENRKSVLERFYPEHPDEEKRVICLKLYDNFLKSLNPSYDAFNFNTKRLFGTISTIQVEHKEYKGSIYANVKRGFSSASLVDTGTYGATLTKTELVPNAKTGDIVRFTWKLNDGPEIYDQFYPYHPIPEKRGTCSSMYMAALAKICEGKDIDYNRADFDTDELVGITADLYIVKEVGKDGVLRSQIKKRMV